MSILERAKAHFDKQEVVEISVPEWEDESGNPTILYSKPFTLAERKTLYKFSKDDDLEFLVRLVIMKALDADGNRVFDISQKLEMMNRVDPNVITRIANMMTAAPSVGDIEGN